MRESSGPSRPVINKIALKIALAVAGTTALPALAVRLLVPSLPFWGISLLVTAVGISAYLTTYKLLAARLELARSTLDQIRRHRFDNLEKVHLPPNDELNALIEQVYLTGLTVEREIDELNRLENYRREFLGNVSHELKTPIFSIRGFAETLLDGALQDDRVNRSFVEKILRNADRISNLAEDLSEVARIETGELKMTVEPFSLHRAAREVVESLEPLARAKDIVLAYQVSERLPPVAGDPERIRQVLINLVDNAIKYNNAGGHVEVMARLLPSGEIKVSVVDDGIGVAPEHIARLTERFYRVDTSRSRSQGGTGLGLAIVKHILGAHDSQLMIESHPDRGSTFGFLLPTLEQKESG